MEVDKNLNYWLSNWNKLEIKLINNEVNDVIWIHWRLKSLVDKYKSFDFSNFSIWTDFISIKWVNWNFENLNLPQNLYWAFKFWWFTYLTFDWLKNYLKDVNDLTIPSENDWDESIDSCPWNNEAEKVNNFIYLLWIPLQWYRCADWRFLNVWWIWYYWTSDVLPNWDIIWKKFTQNWYDDLYWSNSVWFWVRLIKKF